MATPIQPLCRKNVSLLSCILIASRAFRKINRLAADRPPIQFAPDPFAGGFQQGGSGPGLVQLPQNGPAKFRPLKSGERHGRFLAEVAGGTFQAGAHDREANADIFHDLGHEGRVRAGRFLIRHNAEIGRLQMGGDLLIRHKPGAFDTRVGCLGPDPLKKGKNLTVLGDIMRNAGDFDKAITAYKGVLEAQPENNEVMAKLGLSLVGQATTVDPPNKEQMQEGLNYMQKYADTVQILPTDSKSDQEFKQSVKDTVEYLKNEQKLKAQPAKAPTRKRT